MSLHVFLALVVAVIVLVVSRLRWPLRPCPKCKGLRTNKGSNRKRYGRCTRCKATGQVRRIGATAVHRFYWSVLGTALRGRMREKVEKAKEKGRYPE